MPSPVQTTAIHMAANQARRPQIEAHRHAIQAVVCIHRGGLTR
jgi:hypothetical protein